MTDPSPKVKLLQLLYQGIVSGETAKTPAEKLQARIEQQQREEHRKRLAKLDTVQLSNFYLEVVSGKKTFDQLIGVPIRVR